MSEPLRRPPKVRGLAPSVVSADLGGLRTSLMAVEPYAVRWHVDVMDGHYVPNLTIGPAFVKTVAEISSLPIDVHLMVNNPDESWQWYTDAGADAVSLHPTCSANARDTLISIASRDVAAGIAINPDDNVSDFSDLLEFCEFAVVMAVRPGFSGQKFMESGLTNVSELRAIVGPEFEIVVDGGVDPFNARRCIEAGADVLVSASAIFSTDDPVLSAKRLADSFAP